MRCSTRSTGFDLLDLDLLDLIYWIWSADQVDFHQTIFYPFNLESNYKQVVFLRERRREQQKKIGKFYLLFEFRKKKKNLQLEREKRKKVNKQKKIENTFFSKFCAQERNFFFGLGVRVTYVLLNVQQNVLLFLGWFITVDFQSERLVKRERVNLLIKQHTQLNWKPPLNRIRQI